MKKIAEYEIEGKYVYLSGPMTGRKDWNREEFYVYYGQLKGMGATYVFNPAWDAPHGDDPHGHEWWMLRSLSELTRMRPPRRNGGAALYDCIALMPGWQQSKGAMAEYQAAMACGIEAVEL